jgi:hypothetical protein
MQRRYLTIAFNNRLPKMDSVLRVLRFRRSDAANDAAPRIAPDPQRARFDRFAALIMISVFRHIA